MMTKLVVIFILRSVIFNYLGQVGDALTHEQNRSLVVLWIGLLVSRYHHIRRFLVVTVLHIRTQSNYTGVPATCVYLVHMLMKC
jgi:hypothetical protein